MSEIVIDLDGTLRKTHGLLLRLVNWKHGTDYNLRDIERWDWDANDRIPEVDNDEFWATWNYMMEEGLPLGAPLMHPEVPEYVKDLSRDHAVTVATSVSPEGGVVARRWLERNDILRHVDFARLGQDDHDKINEFEPDFLVEDCPEYYKDYVDTPMHQWSDGEMPTNSVSKHPETTLVMHATPWNDPERNSPDGGLPPGVVRLEDWPSIYAFLKNEATGHKIGSVEIHTPDHDPWLSEQ